MAVICVGAEFALCGFWKALFQTEFVSRIVPWAMAQWALLHHLNQFCGSGCMPAAARGIRPHVHAHCTELYMTNAMKGCACSEDVGIPTRSSSNGKRSNKRVVGPTQAACILLYYVQASRVYLVNIREPLYIVTNFRKHKTSTPSWQQPRRAPALNIHQYCGMSLYEKPGRPLQA